MSHLASNLCKVGRRGSGLEAQGDRSWMFQNGNEPSSHFVFEIGKDVQMTSLNIGCLCFGDS